MLKQSVRPANAKTETSISSLIEQWRHTVIESKATAPQTDAEENALAALLDRRDEIAESIAGMPAATAQELLAKIEVLHWMLDPVHRDITGQDLAMLGSLKSDVEALSAGGHSTGLVATA